MACCPRLAVTPASKFSTNGLCWKAKRCNTGAREVSRTLLRNASPQQPGGRCFGPARALHESSVPATHGVCDDDDTPQFTENYAELGAGDIVRTRTGWLALFGVGLVLAAGVVEEFDDLISAHVQLSFFVPLIMGHGGNAGAQTTCAVIRALALKQACWKNALAVVGKEALAGAVMGGALGAGVLALALLAAPTGHGVSIDVALTVAVAMPVISLWSNGLGAFLTLASAKLRLDPAMTSAPLVTTIVDSTALVIYFVIAKAVISEDLIASLAAHSSIFASIVGSSP
ncbi:hypothetical protein FOA52_005575 [Chlamydomonas sp. UWO 241]|nr:hypothetical protein FOA52_005575 [Chlamydomonas sp. UWO 241]